MRTHARAVVVGGGAVGAGIAYHLAKAGWTDTVLLERDELTSGSTWHAAGLLPLFNMGYATSHIHDYSVKLYKALEAETGLNAGFSVVGNLAAILPALALIPVFLIPETRRDHGSPRRLAPAVRSLMRVPKARVAFGALAGVAAVLALVEPLLPLDLSDRLNLSSLGIGIVFAVGLVSYFALVPVGGRWSDRRGRRTPLVVGGVLMAAGLPRSMRSMRAPGRPSFASTSSSLAAIESAKPSETDSVAVNVSISPSRETVDRSSGSRRCCTRSSHSAPVIKRTTPASSRTRRTTMR
jgi:hypothetical protein